MAPARILRHHERMHPSEPTKHAPAVAQERPAQRHDSAEGVTGEPRSRPSGGRDEQLPSHVTREPVMEAGLASFPASDAPSWWAGA